MSFYEIPIIVFTMKNYGVMVAKLFISILSKMSNLLTCVKTANYGCYVGLGAIHIYREAYCKVHKTIYIPFYLEEKKVLYEEYV